MAQPYYVAFDLDETLGCFHSSSLYCILLDPISFYESNKMLKPFTPSEDLVKQLDTALSQFAACLASTDKGKLCLRPGIVEIVNRLSNLQEQGKIKKIVVYSNNGNLASLKLATRMIEHILGKPGIFCDHIHYFHPVRVPHNTSSYSQPGKANKTFQTFKKLFSYKCGESGNEESIVPQNCIFFDDTKHVDLLMNLPPNNYFNVNPYKVDTDYNTLNSCFETALKSVGLDTSSEYFRFISRFTNGAKNLDDVLNYINKDNLRYALNQKPFVNDTIDIAQGINSIFSSSASSSSSSVLPSAPNAPVAQIANAEQVNYGSNYFPVVGGSKVKKTLKHKKKHKKRKTYHKSHSKR